MVKAPYFDSNGIKKGAWDREEDDRLKTFIHRYGHNKISWRLVPIYAGLKRCGKSCRLRWLNYLNPDLIRGDFTTEEHDLIVKLHEKYGSRWSTIAGYFPGRTDNDIKNYWHGHIKKRRSPKKSKKAIDKRAKNEEEASSSMNDHHNSKSSSSDNLTEPSSSKNFTSSEESFDAQENLSTELISDSWDPIRELSESFDFGIFQDTDSWNSFTDPTSYSKGEFSSGSFWGETSYVIEPKVYGSSSEEEILYDIFSNGSPGFWDTMSTTCFN